MSETSNEVPVVQSDDQESASGTSAGELLRRAREEAGLSLVDLAGILKVNIKKLEALESDRLNLLPNPVFTRGLASSVCRTLKLDPGTVLALLPRTDATGLIEERVGLNTPFRTPSDMVSESIWDQISRPAILAALAVLIAALVLILFPTTDLKTETGTAAASEPATTERSEQAALSVATAPAEPVQADTAVVATAESAAPAGGAGGQVSTEVALPPPSTSPAPVEAATATATPEAKPAPVISGFIVFSTRGQSWIEVVDAEGGVRLSRLMEAGESARASGPLPLKVVVGSVDLTDVTVRGKPFDLNPVTRNNVARFEVK